MDICVYTYSLYELRCGVSASRGMPGIEYLAFSTG